MYCNKQFPFRWQHSQVYFQRCIIKTTFVELECVHTICKLLNMISNELRKMIFPSADCSLMLDDVEHFISILFLGGGM